jgi:hypothetical protein
MIKVKIYKTIIFPVVLYEWSQSLREGQLIEVFDKTELKIIFGPERK